MPTPNTRTYFPTLKPGFSFIKNTIMIAYIDGKLTYKDATHAVIDVHGVGYEIRISLQTFGAIQEG